MTEIEAEALALRIRKELNVRTQVIPCLTQVEVEKMFGKGAEHHEGEYFVSPYLSTSMSFHFGNETQYSNFVALCVSVTEKIYGKGE